MAYLKPYWRKLSGNTIIQIGFFASAIVTWPILAEMELFERFYDYSRAHEDWDLDEVAMLVVNLSLALMASVYYQAIRMKKIDRERQFEHERAEQNAQHDPLTGLKNRRAFTTKLRETEAAVSKSGHRLIGMIDLDRFKPVNDLHGHAAGDATLRAVAQRVEAEIGADGFLARLGGDEFAVIFGQNLKPAQAERIARRMLLAIEQPVEFNDIQIMISSSIGLVHWVEDLSSAEVLRRADKALYTAKKQGRGRFAWYDADLDRQSTARAEIEADLRDAIRKSEIEPWFQPIVDIGTHTLIGFEVLARWNHPTKGQIPPGVFVEIAEDSGQIGMLGMSLLKQACMSASKWDTNLSISFNLSALQFHDPKLVKQINSLMVDYDFDPKRLIIEITESSVIRDFAAARTKLMALKETGVSVALDDFGTGYSSLASLRQLPFDQIKIDRSFVTNIASQPQNQKIVAGIMSLAGGLELDVTAEGIESNEDLAYLKTLECSLGQGFLFDKALPADQISWMLETQWIGGQIDANEPEPPEGDTPSKAG